MASSGSEARSKQDIICARVGPAAAMAHALMWCCRAGLHLPHQHAAAAQKLCPDHVLIWPDLILSAAQSEAASATALRHAQVCRQVDLMPMFL